MLDLKYASTLRYISHLNVTLGKYITLHYVIYRNMIQTSDTNRI